MDCKYFKRAGIFKRAMGICGYCQRYGITLHKHKKLSYHPYFQCKDMHNKEVNDCEIDIMADKQDKAN